MSHIVRFRIEHLAGRENPIECELDRNLNVIFGFNGCGKTSLLRILHSAMTGDATILQHVPFSSAEVQIYSMNFSRIFTRRYSKPELLAKSDNIVSDGNQKQLPLGYSLPAIPAPTWSFTLSSLPPVEQLPGWTEEPTISEAAPRNSLTRWNHRYLPTTRLQILEEAQFSNPTNAGSSGSGQAEEQLDQFAALAVRSLWGSYATGILSSVSKIQEEGLAKILEEVLIQTSGGEVPQSPIDPIEAYNSLKAFLHRRNSEVSIGSLENFRSRLESERSFQRVVLDIHSVEQQSNRIVKPKDSLQTLISHLFSGGKTVKFDESSIHVFDRVEHEIDLAQLSSGEKHLLRILVETLLVGDSSLMIDEPELSLHIDWQHDLLRNMNILNQDAQLIVATHSPEIMADVPESKVISL